MMPFGSECRKVSKLHVDLFLESYTRGTTHNGILKNCRVVRLVYDSRNKSTCNLEALQHSEPSIIIVHPSKLLIIDHDCYTLRKALIAILATLQYFKIPL